MGKGKLILICQSGGKFVTDDDGTMTYTGGEAEAIDINHETTFDDFKLKLAKLLNLDYHSLSLKYFLPGNRRTLITLKQDKDMKRMYDFHLTSVTAQVFITGQQGFHSLSPPNRSNNIAVGIETTPVACTDVANVPIQVVTATPGENYLVDVNLRSRKVAPRLTSESAGLVDIPVTISTNPEVAAKSTSKNYKRKGKNILVSNICNLTPKSCKRSLRGTNSAAKTSPPISLSVVCGVTSSSPTSVSKQRNVMEEPSLFLQDENVGDTRRRSLRNRGDIRKPVVETDDDDYICTDEDDDDVDLDLDLHLDVDDKDYVQDIETYYPETEDIDSEREINYSISNDNNGSVESLVASWKRCISGVGQGFQSVVEFRDALQKYAVACRFGYRLRKNESNRACGVCLVGGCPWKIYASWVPSESVFRIKKFNRRHTCGGESWKSAHPKKNWVVSIIKERLQENPNQKTKNIADAIFQDFGIELSYCTIRRGIDEAKGGLHTSFKEAYKHLPQFVNKIVEANPGSLVDLVVGEDRRFQRLFLSFQSCIHGFQTGCRPLLFLDAIPFKSRYHEILLTASALDGDDGVLPVALALVDVETNETWRWFLEQLKVAVPSLQALTFVSDREKGLMSCVFEIFEDAHHGYSIHYLMEDFMRSLRGPFLGDGKSSLSYYLLAAARADRLDGFKFYTEQIKRVSDRAYDWVMQIESKQWASALFEGEPYSHITSDVGEMYSKWIEETQETSIVQKLVAFVSRIVELVNSRQVKSKQWLSQLVPSKEESLVEECKKASMLKVFFCSDTLFEVHDGSVQLVDISNQNCSCFGWKPTGLPCQHAIAVLNRKGRNLYDYCSSFFTVEMYRSTYSEALGAVAVDLTLVENEGSSKEEDEQLLPPLFSRVQGIEKRIKDRKRGRSVCCTKCGGVGHNKATCKDD